MVTEIDEFRLGDIGTIFKIRVLELDGATPVPLQSCVTKQIIFTKPDETQVTKTAVFTTDGSDGYIQYTSVDGDLDQAGIWKMQGFVAFDVQEWHTTVDNFLVLANEPPETTINSLLPTLRLRIGDIDNSSYRYMDEWLVIALIASVRSLERYWGSKYIISEGGIVTRNTDYDSFEFEEEDGIIQKKDENIIVLKAAIITLGGSLENSAWSIGSWRDSEIAVSTIESGRLRGETLTRLQAELDSIIKSPSRQLAKGYRQSILEIPE